MAALSFQYQFTFQYVFDEYTSQKAVFDYVACPLVDDLLRGKNGKNTTCSHFIIIALLTIKKFMNQFSFCANSLKIKAL